MNNKLYFASATSGSEEEAESIRLGYMKPGDTYYQLQRNDELSDGNVTDEDAVRMCIRDAKRGDPYAIEQLNLAQTDILVRKIQS